MKGSESRLAYAPTVSCGFLPYGSPRFPASYFRRFLTLPYGDFSLHNRSQLIKLYETNRAGSILHSWTNQRWKISLPCPSKHSEVKRTRYIHIITYFYLGYRFFPKLKFFAWFPLHIIICAGRIIEVAMGGVGAAQRPFLPVKEPKKTGVHIYLWSLEYNCICL